ncbi:MAG: AmmeMemoRadiSam system protein B [Acidobacteriota bacterium]
MASRKPAVAGSFYTADPEALREEIERLLAGRTPPAQPRGIALMVPHAGYIYSGRVAADAYTSVRLSPRAVILGPNHTGEGHPVAVMREGSWSLPFGEAAIDAPLAGAILDRCPGAREDDRAHRSEHSLEVQVPFLQRLLPSFRFVPICVGTLRLPLLLDLGRAVAEAIRAAGEDVLILISSDMSHYIPAATAQAQDRKAIDRILALDPEGLHRVVLEESISMCGIAPAVAGLDAARRLGARSARLVSYANSGDRSGDYRSVVAYAGIAVT